MDKNDEFLFNRLFVNYSKLLLVFFSTRVSCVSDAEDLVQEVFVACVGNIKKLSSSSDKHKRNWLFAVARNKLFNYYQYKKRHTPPESYDDSFFESSISYEVDFIAEITISVLPDDDVIISDILFELPKKEHELYDFVYIQRVPYGKLASLYGISITALRMRISRLKCHIREKLNYYLK